MVFENANTMITLIHGDDISASRSYYKSLQGKQVQTFDGEKVTIGELTESLQSLGLFGNENQICFENFFSKRKTSRDMTAILSLIETYDADTTFILWESKQLTKKTTESISHATIKSFPLPKSLFSFLDSIKPQNKTKMLMLYHETLEYTPPEMILFMITKQIRILLAFHDTKASLTIDEVVRIAPWQKQKLTLQANLFTTAQLLKLHAHIFDLDVKSKSGGLSLPLAQTIDFFLASI